MFSPVNWLKPRLALLMMALWVPATSHCDLERLPGLQFLACEDEADRGSHSSDDCADACATLESGFYKTEERPLTILTPILSVLCVPPVLTDEPGGTAHCPALDSPTLRRISQAWQFSFRTALPPRAPSSAS